MQNGKKDYKDLKKDRKPLFISVFQSLRCRAVVRVCGRSSYLDDFHRSPSSPSKTRILFLTSHCRFPPKASHCVHFVFDFVSLLLLYPLNLSVNTYLLPCSVPTHDNVPWEANRLDLISTLNVFLRW